MNPYLCSSLSAGFLAIAFGSALALELPARDDYAYGFALGVRGDSEFFVASPKP